MVLIRFLIRFCVRRSCGHLLAIQKEMYMQCIFNTCFQGNNELEQTRVGSSESPTAEQKKTSATLLPRIFRGGILSTSGKSPERGPVAPFSSQIILLKVWHTPQSSIPGFGKDLQPKPANGWPGGVELEQSLRWFVW